MRTPWCSPCPAARPAGCSRACPARRQRRRRSAGSGTRAWRSSRWLPPFGVPHAPEGSGYLVPAVDGHPVKAVTFSSIKWPHLQAGHPELILVRCSVGRVGEESVLHREDGELAPLAADDLAAATGVHGHPVDARVTRWGGALPSTRSATASGWPRSVRRSPPSPGWPCAARPTTASAFPRASPRPGPLRTRLPRTCGSARRPPGRADAVSSTMLWRHFKCVLQVCKNASQYRSAGSQYLIIGLYTSRAYTENSVCTTLRSS